MIFQMFPPDEDRVILKRIIVRFGLWTLVFCCHEIGHLFLDVPLEVSKWLVNGLFHLLMNEVYWGYNPLTNHLRTSWHIKFFLFGTDEDCC